MTSSDKSVFHHAICFREDLCIGCSHCMNICPTEAVRVKAGKAILNPNRCIDCGECYRACPVGAIIVEQDDFARTREFPVRVALVPSVFTGQFPDSATIPEIFSAIVELGFTHVFEVEEGVEFLTGRINNFIQNNPDSRPFISSFCPAVVRLVQVKFPTLTGHIIPMPAPVDIVALHARRMMEALGYTKHETGIFYVTPCAAKIVAVRNPVGSEQSPVDGVISMNDLYNKVFRILRMKKGNDGTVDRPVLQGRPVRWSLTHGEADQINNGKSLAIDEIFNVIEFLEKVESEGIDGIDYLELRACDESCAGGILCPGNRFLTADKLRKRAASGSGDEEQSASDPGTSFPPKIDLPDELVRISKITPRPMMKLDDQVAGAMVKMKKIYELNRQLPQVDCGICGSPTCKALAEDIVQNNATIKQCIFVQKILEQNEKLDVLESVQIMQSIWSDKKMDKNGLKDEINEIK